VLDQGDTRVYGDRQRLQQAVWNLLANAVKFTRKGGSVQAGVRRAGSEVSIVVADTGEGIAPEVLPFVFDRFRQGDSSSTRSHAGLGLGLAIAKHIVELHGGRIEAESEGPGRGATFRLTLPVSPAAVAASPAPTQTAKPAITTGSLAVPLPDLAGTHVLVVEDDTDAREMVAYFLRERGADVAAAASVEDGLRAFDARRPDVLLSDIEMPHRDGFALIAAVRARSVEAGGDVPAAALTAYSRPEDRAASMLAGYDAHLSKPVDLHELVATVARLRARRRA
jgi:CheY-like chemotaxis protein